MITSKIRNRYINGIGYYVRRTDNWIGPKISEVVYNMIVKVLKGFQIQISNQSVNTLFRTQGNDFRSRKAKDMKESVTPHVYICILFQTSVHNL